MHFLKRDLIVASDPGTVWDFLSSPHNLNELTPPDLHFRILSELPATMHNGLTILYEIRIPVVGRRRWLTEIKHIEAGAFFVDEQRLGPYRFWYHEHRIAGCGDARTRVTDQVCYALPGSVVGFLVNALWVRPMLEDIFDYRARRMTELFGE